MDIDALLLRKPEIALVDELAHTNLPGSRNEKRWQDVNELLACRNQCNQYGQYSTFRKYSR